MRIDEPAPGVALLFAYPMGEQVARSSTCTSTAPPTRATAERWRDWMAVPSAG